MNIGITTFAAAGSWEQVGDAIERSVESVNELFGNLFGFMTNKEVYKSIVAAIPESVKSAVAATALSLLTLFFFIGFLGKTLNLQWVTWENVLMLLLQLTIAKVCVDNAEWLMDKTQNAFSSMVQSVNVDDIEFIDTSSTTKVTLTARDGSAFLIFGDSYETKELNVPDRYFYFLDKTDAAAAYGTWSGNFVVKPKAFDFSPVFAYMSVFVSSLLMKAILVIALVMMISRYMWLAVYTIAAPLSLSTFASDETKDIGKSFIKSYIGCCLHAMVLVIICVSFGAVSTVITGVEGLGSFIGLIKTFAFGGMVMKSESIANKLCGAM